MEPHLKDRRIISYAIIVSPAVAFKFQTSRRRRRKLISNSIALWIGGRDHALFAHISYAAIIDLRFFSPQGICSFFHSPFPFLNRSLDKCRKTICQGFKNSLGVSA